jgi:hypothetical protein
MHVRLLRLVLGLALLRGALLTRGPVVTTPHDSRQVQRQRPPSSSQGGPGRAVVVAAIVGLVVVVAGAAGPVGDLPGREFYATAAQIFPVLLVPLALDRRAHGGWRTAGLPRWSLIGSLLLGELFALVALSGTFATERTRDYQDYIASDLQGADLKRVMEDGPLVAGSPAISQVFAAFTAGALVVAVVSVFVLTTARAEQ